MTSAIAATEFVRRFDHDRRQARRESIAVSDGGEVTGYFVSPETMRRVEEVLLASRRAYHPSELPEATEAALSEARTRPECDHLNALLGPEPDTGPR